MRTALEIHRDYGRARRGFDSESGFYQSAAWRAVRAAYLREHPMGALVPRSLLSRMILLLLLAILLLPDHSDRHLDAADPSGSWRG